MNARFARGQTYDPRYPVRLTFDWEDHRQTYPAQIKRSDHGIKIEARVLSKYQVASDIHFARSQTSSDVSKHLIWDSKISVIGGVLALHSRELIKSLLSAPELIIPSWTIATPPTHCPPRAPPYSRGERRRKWRVTNAVGLNLKYVYFLYLSISYKFADVCDYLVRPNDPSHDLQTM